MILETLIELVNIKLTTFIFYAFTTFTIISATSLVVKVLNDKEKASHWKQIAQKRRTERDQQIKLINIPPLSISENLRQKILDSDAATLVEMLKSFEVISEQILVVYFQRASTIGVDYELITDISFREALLEARRCDQLRKENPAACDGALFGLPISVKELFILKGTDASCGVASRLYNLAKDDGYLVKILKGEGAIPFLKSNIPQAVLNLNSSNNIWGWSKNPWNKARIAGGSSGGEGGLIAARCSPLGIGNDLGGSIRIPALFCGLVGFKATGDRVTRAGTIDMGPMIDFVPALKLVTGPIAKSVRDVNLTMKALLSDRAQQNTSLIEQDLHYVRIPWKEEEVFSKRKNMRVGYFKGMDRFPPSLANRRAVDEAVRALKRIGYEVIEVEFSMLDDLAYLFSECFSLDGELRFLKDLLNGESLIEDFTSLKLLVSLPSLVKKMMHPILNAVGEKRLAVVLETLEKKNAYELIKALDRQARLRKEFFRIWEGHNLDALISPGLAIPAPEPVYAKDVQGSVCYTGILNVLDVPTGVVPVTVVKEGEDDYPLEITEYHDMMYRQTKKSIQGSVGMPVGVQVSTLPWKDEKCVGIMLDLEEQLQFRQKHPLPI